MTRTEKIIVGGSALQMMAGVWASLHYGDIRPAMVTCGVAWLGAEYLDHIAQQVRQ